QSRRSVVWGAHAAGVLVSATRRNNLFSLTTPPRPTDDHLERRQGSQSSRVNSVAASLSRGVRMTGERSPRRPGGKARPLLRPRFGGSPKRRLNQQAPLQCRCSLFATLEQPRRFHLLRPARECRRRTAPAQRLDFLKERRIGAQSREILEEQCEVALFAENV